MHRNSKLFPPRRGPLPGGQLRLAGAGCARPAAGCVEACRVYSAVWLLLLMAMRRLRTADCGLKVRSRLHPASLPARATLRHAILHLHHADQPAPSARRFWSMCVPTRSPQARTSRRLSTPSPLPRSARARMKSSACCGLRDGKSFLLPNLFTPLKYLIESKAVISYLAENTV